MVKIEISNNYSLLSIRSAAEVSGAVLENPNLVVGLPTGNTPKGMYHEICNSVKNNEVSFGNATSFNIDEYLDIDMAHPGSFHSYMYNHLFKVVEFKESHFPKVTMGAGNATNGYDKKIQELGGMDLIILGIGTNGHIGFNEPGAPIFSKTHIVHLNE